MRAGRTKYYWFAIMIWVSCVSLSFSQDVTVRGGFFLDSLRVGDETGFYLSASYPSNLNIALPDSSFNYGPFEFISKKYFPTETISGQSYDSVIYYLTTFEIDSLQMLSLPVFQLNAEDSTTYQTDIDTIALIELAKNLPDTLTAQTLPLRQNTIHENVPKHFNYPVLIISLVALLVIAVIIWVLFGKKIRKHFKVKKMLKAHRRFLEIYDQQVENIQKAFSSTQTEDALVHWKKYMEQLESMPYTKLTTRETVRIENNEALGQNLHSIDGAIYGHNTRVVEALENLKQFADQRFGKKIEEVKYG
jgi:Sec-independent protein translocase protein TatA